VGQRGYRRRRARCAFVDPRTGLRCPVQVKKAGNTFCCHDHAVRARTTPRVTAPGAKARFVQARQQVQDALWAVLSSQAVAGCLDPAAALHSCMLVLDKRYTTGYHAGLAAAQKRARALRLTESRAALDQFLGSRFGKAFVGGNLSPDALARFKFGGKR